MSLNSHNNIGNSSFGSNLNMSNNMGMNNSMGMNNQMNMNQMNNNQMNTSSIGSQLNSSMNNHSMNNHQNQHQHNSHNHQNHQNNHGGTNSNQNPQMHMIFSRGMPDDDGQDFYEDERKAFFLGGLHRDMQREDIYNELQKYGLYIRKLDCPYNDKNTKSGNKGYAFVHVKDETMAQKILTLEKLKILNETCSVKPYKRDPNNRKRSGNDGIQRDGANNNRGHGNQLNNSGNSKFNQSQNSGGKSGQFDQRTMDFSFLQNQNYQQNPQLMAMFWQNQFQELYKAHVMLLQNQFMSNPNNSNGSNSNNSNNQSNVPHLPAFPPYTPNFMENENNVHNMTHSASGTPWNPKVQDFVPGHRSAYQNHHYQSHHHQPQPYNPPPPSNRANNITPVGMTTDYQNESLSLINSLFANDKGYDAPTSVVGTIGAKKTSKIPLAKDPILTNDDNNGVALSGFEPLDSFKKKTNGSTVASSTVESSTVIKDEESIAEKDSKTNEEHISGVSVVSGSLATSPNGATSDRRRTDSNSRIVQESESDGNVKRSGSGNMNNNRVKSISSSSTGQAPMYKKQSSIFDDKNTLSASDEQQRRYFSTSRTTSSSSDANNNIISKQ